MNKILMKDVKGSSSKSVRISTSAKMVYRRKLCIYRVTNITGNTCKTPNSDKKAKKRKISENRARDAPPPPRQKRSSCHLRAENEKQKHIAARKQSNCVVAQEMKMMIEPKGTVPDEVEPEKGPAQIQEGVFR